VVFWFVCKEMILLGAFLDAILIQSSLRGCISPEVITVSVVSVGNVPSEETWSQ